MKSDEDVKMISAETPVLFAKACQMFIIELTYRSWAYTEQSKRRTLQVNKQSNYNHLFNYMGLYLKKIDIANCIVNTDIFDFLLDIIPKQE